MINPDGLSRSSFKGLRALSVSALKGMFSSRTQPRLYV